MEKVVDIRKSYCISVPAKDLFAWLKEQGYPIGVNTMLRFSREGQFIEIRWNEEERG